MIPNAQKVRELRAKIRDLGGEGRLGFTGTLDHRAVSALALLDEIESSLQLPAPVKPTWGPESAPLTVEEAEKLEDGASVLTPHGIGRWRWLCVRCLDDGDHYGIYSVPCHSGHDPIDQIRPADLATAIALDREPGQGGQGA